MSTSGSAGNAVDGHAPVEGQVACSMTSTLLRRTRGTHGEQAVDEIIARAAVDYSSDFLEDIGNWIWYSEAVRLFEAAEETLGDEHIGRRVGEDALRQHAGTPVATLLRSLGSPEAIFEQVTRAVAKFTTVTDMETLELEPGHATIRAQARPGYRRHRHMCEYAMGILSQCTCLFGLPMADVEEVCCELRGDDYCLYEVSWDAEGAASAADPQELITALEAQVAAMASRLESMYATARDLIASHDLDAALARITERAATAVRAPKYLLAVRTGNDLRVHHRGFSEEDCRDVAEALIEGKDLDRALGREESRLIAEVASTTNRYGRIMAASPAGSFFPHERELLEVYARYAAAVLDTATALADARRRHEQSRALLELARELVRARTGEEVARRTADAVTRLIDCDWVSVFLWDEEHGVLRCAATAGAEPPVEERLRMLAIDPAESDLLAAVLANPVAEPIYVDRSTTDPVVAQTMPLTGSRGTVALPIVANDRFYGSVNVSATDRPERLRAPAVTDLLVGVAAQTATALDNAWLIEAMSHQARHDNLTGLLGHRAFHEALRDAVESGENEELTLALLDLDDFKLINDEHGHMVGDEALKSVAQALRAAVREPDRLFRIGGEEFALLMPGLDRDDAVGVAERLRAAVAGARFRLPLRVSIGLASWPQDAEDRQRLFELADQALYAAKRDGKDRTRVAVAA